MGKSPTKSGQSLAVNTIKKALRGTAWFFQSLFPLLHHCLANAEDCRRRRLAYVVGHANASNVLPRKGRFGGKQSASTSRIVISFMAPALNKS